MTTPAPHPRPSDEKLRAVYASEAPHRPHWPRTFDAAMRDPLVSRVVMILAQHVAIPQARGWPAGTPTTATTAPPRGAVQRPRQHALEAVDDAEHQREHFHPATARPGPVAGTPESTAAPAYHYHGRRQSALDFKSRAAGERDD